MTPDEVRAELGRLAYRRSRLREESAATAEELRAAVVAARAAGLTVVEIAGLAGISRMHAHRILGGEGSQC